MIVLDANILLYAYNEDASRHGVVRPWLDTLLAGQEWIGLPWVTVWAFLRIVTNSRVYPSPMPAERAFEIIEELLGQPRVQVLEAGRRHLELLRKLVEEGQASGPLLTDAVLAALAQENNAALASTDQDFARFTGLRWVNPVRKSS